MGDALAPEMLPRPLGPGPISSCLAECLLDMTRYDYVTGNYGLITGMFSQIVFSNNKSNHLD
jgi:hypothetical protein